MDPWINNIFPWFIHLLIGSHWYIWRLNEAAGIINTLNACFEVAVVDLQLLNGDNSFEYPYYYPLSYDLSTVDIDLGYDAYVAKGDISRCDDLVSDSWKFHKIDQRRGKTAAER